MAISGQDTQWRLGGDLPVNRVGFGAMRLGSGMRFGPGPDEETAIAVLRRAVELGVNHIDTSDFYGPYTVNERIRLALSPYPEDLVIVTKVGALHRDGKLVPAYSRDELRKAVHDNLGRLGVDRLDLVNLRVGAPLESETEPIEERFTVLAELREEGLIRHLGVSNVTEEQFDAARAIAPVAQVQNRYGLLEREDDPLVDRCAELGIAYVPYFPLGGGITPLASEVLGGIAERTGATVHQLALAWLLARSPSILLIPGTSSLSHLEENLAVSGLGLTGDDRATLDRIVSENQPNR
jgi:aryl-alcohol dehydrogenase-like predicted oxidoreductase